MSFCMTFKLFGTLKKHHRTLTFKFLSYLDISVGHCPFIKLNHGLGPQTFNALSLLDALTALH